MTTFEHTDDPSLYKSLKRYATVFTLITIAGSVLVLAGWQFDIDILKRPMPGSVVMKPVTSVLFILNGISLFILLEKERRKYLFISRFFSIFVSLIATARISEIAFGIYTGIGKILYGNKLPHSIEDHTLNFISLNTAIIFLLLGLILFAISFENKRLR